MESVGNEGGHGHGQLALVPLAYTSSGMRALRPRPNHQDAAPFHSRPVRHHWGSEYWRNLPPCLRQQSHAGAHGGLDHLVITDASAVDEADVDCAESRDNVRKHTASMTPTNG
ncbi:hypothetical protein PG996_007295 [Apiospora saccharicola]|uniref:Uncharacterized protein n=1 Tax=Apiospora saccharicola TaxID=335842 RepID=A0ABR1VAI8_9PEZI